MSAHPTQTTTRSPEAHIIIGGGAGAGRTLLTEVLVESHSQLGRRPVLGEIEDGDARLLRLFDLGRVRAHKFAPLAALEGATPEAQAQLWPNPLAFAMAPAHAPVVLDVADRATPSLLTYLCAFAQASPFARDDGHHGAGLTIWAMWSSDADQTTVSRLRSILPGARLIAVANGSASGQEPTIERLSITVCPSPEIMAALRDRLGLYGLVDMARSKVRAEEMANELGLSHAEFAKILAPILSWIETTVRDVIALLQVHPGDADSDIEGGARTQDARSLTTAIPEALASTPIATAEPVASEAALPPMAGRHR